MINSSHIEEKGDFRYLIHIQYLGFRYHGWAKHKNLRTIHSQIDKSLEYTFCHSNFKILGSSRTDAMVSAYDNAFELFINFQIDFDSFLSIFNKMLPADIRATNIEIVNPHFNIINSPKTKEYIYLFAHAEKSHPYCAPFLYCIPDVLDIETMKKGASLFEGKHNFRKYCVQNSNKTNFEREITKCYISEHTEISANFFPKQVYELRIAGYGFMHKQIRLIMGQLFELGKGTITLDDLSNSILNPNHTPLRHIAPASGLHLHKTNFH